jgi:hypothetical protein
MGLSPFGDGISVMMFLDWRLCQHAQAVGTTADY